MFQQVILLGNLGSDPEMRYTPSGVPVTSFSLAVNRRWTSQDGQQQEKTLWFRVSAWRRDAEIASQYLSKGRQVLIVGELEEPRTYQDRDGNTRVSLDVTARNIRLVGSRGDNATAGGGFGQEAPATAGGAAKGKANNNAPGHDNDLTDEDIPF
jgi:single-strand DNA-binding protein